MKRRGSVARNLGSFFMSCKPLSKAIDSQYKQVWDGVGAMCSEESNAKFPESQIGGTEIHTEQW